MPRPIHGPEVMENEISDEGLPETPELLHDQRGLAKYFVKRRERPIRVMLIVHGAENPKYLSAQIAANLLGDDLEPPRLKNFLQRQVPLFTRIKTKEPREQASRPMLTAAFVGER